MKNTRKPYAMGGTTDALTLAPTANYSGQTMIQDMSDAWPGRRGRASRKANKYNKRNINCRGNKCYNPSR